MNIILEGLVVGIVTAVFGFIIATGLMFFEKDFSLSTYHFWPRVLLGYFITGIAIHFIFQLIGANKWYCKNGVACKSL